MIFGDTLREARTGAGKTLEQVSALTRVRVAVLRDLEAGVMTSGGGPVYARGHVHSIAQALGIDPAPLLAAFDAEAGTAPETVVDAPHLGVARTGPLRVPWAGRPERSTPRWGVAAGAAVSVLVVLLAVGTFRDGARRAPAPSDALFAGEPTPQASRATPSARPLTAAVPRTSGARMRVRVLTGSSWVRVQGSAGTLFEGVLAPGAAPKDFTDARELRLLVGNAAALSVVCDGKDLAPAGTPGAVRRFTCGANGLVAS